MPGVAGFVESWGERLLGVALVYAVISMIVTYAALASGAEPPRLVPDPIITLYRKAMYTWGSISGRVYEGTSVVAALRMVYQSLDLFMTLVLSGFASVALGFVWIAWSLTALLPYPLSLLSVPIWVLAVTANLIMVLYLIGKVLDIVSRFV